MAKPQKFGLGRGLDALISGASDVIPPHQAAQNGTPDELPVVSIDSIIPNPRQPRRIFREDDPKLLELRDSIKELGLIQPIVVTRLESQAAKSKKDAADAWLSEGSTTYETALPAAAQYQIIAGERRWRASKLAGLTKVPIVIKDVTPQQMLEMALIENIQRADLNPIEEAMAYQQLIQDFSLTQEEVAKRVGKDRSTVTNSLRLLQLPAKIRESLINQVESFTEGHARALVSIAKEDDQLHAMNQIIAQHLTVRQAEELATRLKASEDIETAVKAMQVPASRSPELESLETNFRDALMMKVDLKCNAKGKGTLVLHFNNQNELEDLYSRLAKQQAEGD